MSELAFDLFLRLPGRDITMEGRIPLDGVTALMGPSGSGKTTLLRMLAGLESRARGDIRMGDAVWSSGKRGLTPETRRVGMVFQDARLFAHMTVAENIAFGATRRGVPAAAIEGIASGLGLGALMDRRPATLSGGEARRVALARALASAPDILFLDEPLSALDDDAKGQVLPYLARAVSESGVPVLYVTHAHEEVTRFADRVLHIRDGRVEGWGRPPSRLAVTVTGETRGHVTVDLEGTPLVLPGHGRPGDARVIGIPDNGLLISEADPGTSGALAQLRGEVHSVRRKPGGAELVIGVGGQRLQWRVSPSAPLSDRLPEPGQRLVISLLQAFLR